jgi:hypothetical protein
MLRDVGGASETSPDVNGGPLQARLAKVHVRGYRSVGNVAFSPGPICALVGEARAGKSNILAAIRVLLDPQAPPLRPDDATAGGTGRIRIDGELSDERRVSIAAEPPRAASAVRTGAPPVLYLPASLRGGPVLAPSKVRRTAVQPLADLMRDLMDEPMAAASTTGAAHSFVGRLERWCVRGFSGFVLLIEEPELYLRPQSQRYLYRLFQMFVRNGNQIIYSTHAPAFLNVARLEELTFVERHPRRGTRVHQPDPVPPAAAFRALSEFDAERSELFLARAAVLLEGKTEKLALPFMFRALGYDVDREGITLVECGGKPNMPLFIRICKAADVPFVVVHDRDAPSREREPHETRVLNDLIAAEAGPDRTIVLEPEFEPVAGLRARGHKPEHAWRRFASLSREAVPEPLVRAIEIAVRLTGE